MPPSIGPAGPVSPASDVTWADAMQGWGTMLTFVVAAVAALVAWHQFKDARNLRREQAQPYVVVYAEPSSVRARFIEVVIKNFGTTGARDLEITTSPPLQRTNPGGGEGIETVHLPDGTPFMAPGQEWRTLWDLGPRREASDLPDRHDVSVSYTDSYKKRHTTKSVLDWSLFRGRMNIGMKNINDVVAQLETIARVLDRLADERPRR